MDAYLPHGLGGLALLIATLSGLFFGGYFAVSFARIKWMRSWLWLLTTAGFAWVNLAFWNEPAGFRMGAIVLTLLLNMKLLMLHEYRLQAGEPMALGRWFVFAGLWLGMDPMKFVERRRMDLRLDRGYLSRGWRNLAIGALLALIAHQVYSHAGARIIPTLLLMIGFSLVVHFGVIQIMVGVWRKAGFSVTPLFRNPVASKSLAEFWGRRWNLGFMEMMTLAVVRPLRRRFDRGSTTFFCFLLSGIFHDMAISFPVKSGYGLPTTYFLLHGFLVLAERRFGCIRTITGRKIVGRIWTLTWLIVPGPLLFHPAFVKGVLWPLL